MNPAGVKHSIPNRNRGRKQDTFLARIKTSEMLALDVKICGKSFSHWSGTGIIAGALPGQEIIGLAHFLLSND